LKTYYLTDKLRNQLKTPLGDLIEGEPRVTVNFLNLYIEDIKPLKVLSVGDFVTSNILRRGICIDVCIIDGRIMRKEVEPLSLKTNKVINVTNPPGTISSNAWEAICQASKGDEKVAILVDGEEDLLALPAIICAPSGSLVVYGQPRRGIVLVRVNERKKLCVKKILKEMIAINDI
jgi:uncharacterized protein (UPF0218 family)